MSKTQKFIKIEREKQFSDLKNGTAYSLHLFHYGRLIALGMTEKEASDEIFNTAATIEALIDNGVQFDERSILEIYNKMPMPSADNAG